MGFDWGTYLTLAEDLKVSAANGSIQEAKLRSAVSRAYYSAFCTALNTAKRVDRYIEPKGSRGSHLALVEHFTQHVDPVRKGIGADLDRMRKSRTKADYREGVPSLENLATKTLLLSKSVLNDLASL
jgi:uncharacterized protein (UPF0332 family)